MSTWAIILAAGSGSRMAAFTNGIPKQFLQFGNRPLYWHSALAMSKSGCIDGLVFVFPPEHCENERKRTLALAAEDNLSLEWRIAAGGQKRQDSSRLGLEHIPIGCSNVLIHDAARCFVTPHLIRRVCAQISPESPAVAPSLPVTDTIKLLADDNSERVERSLPRSRLRAVQTPQGFMTDLLRTAHAQAGDIAATDDLALIENLGAPVSLIEGEAGNQKITNPEDLTMLAQCESHEPCSGFGYDVHRFGKGRPLKLGGIAIPGGYEVEAHSDGDVLLHSLIDALLGCACLGDIGHHFPDNDPRFENISSAILLDHTLGLLQKAGVELCHVDLTVIAQKPKLAPYAAEIKKNVARLLGISSSRVNFKATTEEGLGFTGAGEGIKAYALASAKSFHKD